MEEAAQTRLLRSKVVIVTFAGLAGAATLVSFAEQSEKVRRNLYSDRAGCERDYSPALCAPNSSYFGGEWIGPEYYEDRNAAKAKKDPGPGRAGGAVRVLQSERGGFGAVGRYLRTVG